MLSSLLGQCGHWSALVIAAIATVVLETFVWEISFLCLGLSFFGLVLCKSLLTWRWSHALEPFQNEVASELSRRTFKDAAHL